MIKRFEVKEKCQSCDGTGLYVGMAERDGAAVVCHTCRGTGCHTFMHEYGDFDKRIERWDVSRVFEINPGICINGSITFGGMLYKDWKRGKKFKPGMENRLYTCPAWWYQSADYSKKPDWKECEVCGLFSSCSSFWEKEKCWLKWDKQEDKG